MDLFFPCCCQLGGVQFYLQSRGATWVMVCVTVRNRMRNCDSESDDEENSKGIIPLRPEGAGRGKNAHLLII